MDENCVNSLICSTRFRVRLTSDSHTKQPFMFSLINVTCVWQLVHSTCIPHDNRHVKHLEQFGLCVSWICGVRSGDVLWRLRTFGMKKIHDELTINIRLDSWNALNKLNVEHIPRNKTRIFYCVLRNSPAASKTFYRIPTEVAFGWYWMAAAVAAYTNIIG